MSGERADGVTPAGGVRVGDVIDGTYRIEETLGRGGMGAVFGATDLKKNRRVAIKTLLATGDDRETTERLVREARASVIPASEHVAKVLDVGALPTGAPFLILERLDGETLDAYIRRESPLPVPTVVDLVLQACVGLAAAHAAGIVHRDVKPSNLFLVRAPSGMTLKILDFGISKFRRLSAQGPELATLTETGVTLGSPQYMSPEQVRSSRDVDARADLFSLGLVIHRALTNKLPFEANDAASYVFQIVSSEATPARVQRPDVPEGLERVILRCLEKRPSRRYKNVAELAAALAPFGTAAGRATAELAAAFLPELESPPSSRVDFSEAPTAKVGSGGESTAATPPSERLHPIPTATRSTAWRTATALAAIALVAAGGAIAFAVFGGRAAAPASVGSTSVAAPPPAALPIETAAARAAPSATAKEPTRVTIQVVVDAPGATVELDGEKRDGPIELERSDDEHRLVVSAPGFETETREIVADQDLRLELGLKRVVHAPPPPPPPTQQPERRLHNPALMEQKL